MKLTLNIYNSSDIVKTYSTELDSLTTKFCIKFFKGTGFEEWMGKNDAEMSENLVKIILKNFDLYFDLFKYIFPELTDEEWENTHITEITSGVMALITFTISHLFTLSEATKN